MKFAPKVIARAARVSGNENPVVVYSENVYLSKGKGGVDGGTSRGKVSRENKVNTSKVLHWSMVRTRGGLITSPTPPPRVFTTDKGVKVRKVNGGFRYQPPTLKVISLSGSRPRTQRREYLFPKSQRK